MPSPIMLPRGAVYRALRERAEARGSSTMLAHRVAQAAIDECRDEKAIRKLCRVLGIEPIRTRTSKAHEHARQCDAEIHDASAYNLRSAFSLPAPNPREEHFRDRRPSDPVRVAYHYGFTESA